MLFPLLINAYRDDSRHAPKSAGGSTAEMSADRNITYACSESVNLLPNLPCVGNIGEHEIIPAPLYAPSNCPLESQAVEDASSPRLHISYDVQIDSGLSLYLLPVVSDWRCCGSLPPRATSHINIATLVAGETTGTDTRRLPRRPRRASEAEVETCGILPHKRKKWNCCRSPWRGPPKPDWLRFPLRQEPAGKLELYSLRETCSSANRSGSLNLWVRGTRYVA